MTAAGVVISSAGSRLTRPLGDNKSTFIRGHKPSEAVAAAASAAVRKITGRTEPSPPSTPPTLPKQEETSPSRETSTTLKDGGEKEEGGGGIKNEVDSNYIGPQVPPDMAKKLGLSVDSSSPKDSPGTSSASNNGNWKAHVGAKLKSEKTHAEKSKKPEAPKSDFMTPPEKDEQYKGRFFWIG